MIGITEVDPNKFIQTGFVFQNEAGPLMVIGFNVFQGMLSVLVRNMDTGRVSDHSYTDLVPLVQKAMLKPLWT